MLQSIRENIKGLGAWVIVLFLCVPFAFWGITDYFDNRAGGAAATVNGEEISSFQVEQAYQQRYQELLRAFGNQLPPDLINQQALRREQLNQLIMEELLRQKMQDEGYRASSEQVRERIRSMPVFQDNGEFSVERYRQALAMAGRSPAAFEALLRRDIALEQLQQGIAESEFATPREAAFVMALEEQGRRHAAIIVPDEAFADRVEISAADAEAYYQENQSRFLTDEKVDVTYVELVRDRYAGQVEVSDERLREVYENRADQYASQEERVASHILIEGEGDAARAEAEAALARVQAGEEFAKVAQDVSDDPVSAEEGGKLGVIQRGQLEGPFEDTLFAMQEGEVRGPVQSDFGYHIIRLDSINAPELPAFEDIREQLAADYREEQAQRAFDDAVRMLADATFQSGDSLETVAEDMGLEVAQAEGITRGGGPGIGGNAEVRAAIFSDAVLHEGFNSDPIQLDEDRVVVVRVAEHFPAQPKPLAEVEAQVRRELLAQRTTGLARAKAEELLERARSGEALGDIAVAENLTFREPSTTYRRTPDVSARYADALFSAEYPVDGPSYAMTPVENNDFVVFAVTQVLPGDYAALTASERETRQRNLRQREASLTTTAYLAEMRNSADVVIREKALDTEPQEQQ